jgi:hypothetical protein
MFNAGSHFKITFSKLIFKPDPRTFQSMFGIENSILVLKYQDQKFKRKDELSDNVK